MKLSDYLKIQAHFVKTEYMTDWEIHNYPAIAYESWEEADKQIDIANRDAITPIRWKHPITPQDQSRTLIHPGFTQFWVRHNMGGYREAGINFLEREYGISERPARKLHADHLYPKIKNPFLDGVTVLYFIPGQVNSSWGAGWEKSTKDRSTKVRMGITLVSTAKAMGIKGTKKGGRTYLDVAKDLYSAGIRSMEYQDKDGYSHHDETLRIETELRAASGAVSSTRLNASAPLKNDQTKTQNSKYNQLIPWDVKQLRDVLPQYLEDILQDGKQRERVRAVDGFIASQGIRTLRGDRILAESVMEFLEKNEKLFSLNILMSRFSAIKTPTGAAAFLLDKCTVVNGQFFVNSGVKPHEYDV